ncbi:UTRA domain-containing protein [Streptomyces sp. Amel2xB2]|nr:UTRA domain-containing protein [Streptomyces sp. Amel2xB2]
MGNWVSRSTPYLTPSTAGQADAWTQEAAAHGARGTNRLDHVGHVQAPAFVADAFGIDEGQPVVARRRIVYLDDAPMEIATSYYPLWIAADTDLAEPRKIKGGAITALASLGYTTASVTEDVVADMPDEETRAALDMDAGEPIITLYRSNRDADGTVFQAEIMTTAAATRRLRYEMEVG